MRSISMLFVAAFGVLVSACGTSSSSTSEPDGAPGGGPVAGEPFTSFCAGRLSKDTATMAPSVASGWQSTTERAAAGTVFLVALDVSNRFTGYIVSGPKPRKLAEPSFATGLTLGADFESSCVTTPNAAAKAFVVLAPATFYADRALTGAPCAVPAATAFSSYSFSGGPTATVSSSELRARCGFDVGYTNDLVFGFLVQK